MRPRAAELRPAANSRTALGRDIGHDLNLFVQITRPQIESAAGNDWVATSRFRHVPRGACHACDHAHVLAIEQQQIAEPGLADARRVLQHRLEYRLQIRQATR